MKVRWTESKFYLDGFPLGTPGLVKAIGSEKDADVILFIFENSTTPATALTVPSWKYRQMLDQKKVRVNNALTLKRSIDADLLLSTLRAGGILKEEKRHHDEVDPNKHLKQEEPRRAQGRSQEGPGVGTEFRQSQGQVGKRPDVFRKVHGKGPYQGTRTGRTY